MQRNQGTLAIAGHWELTKGAKQYYCSLSGGYVIIGTRVPVSDQSSADGYRVQESQNISVPDYSKSEIRKWIDEKLGAKILVEVEEKVKKVIEYRNKTTLAPGKES